MRCAEPTWSGAGVPARTVTGDGGRQARRLVAAEPHVPGLPLLLDDAVLRSWLAERVPGSSPTGPATGPLRPYLRWKPGAGGVALVDLGPGAGELFLAVWHRAAADKLRKTVARGGDDCVVVDEEHVAVLARPGADRDLPGLVRLHRRGGAALLRRLHPVDDEASRLLRAAAAAAAGAGEPTTLAWKPQRRWVGRAGGPAQQGAEAGAVAGAGARAGAGAEVSRRVAPTVVLRAQRPAAARASAHGYRVVRAVLGEAAPRLLGTDLGRGLVAVEHLTGTTLDRFCRHEGGPGGTAEEAAAAAGALLARLHATHPRRGAAAEPAWCPAPDEREVVRATGGLLVRLVPETGAGAVAAALLAALDRQGPQPQVLVHGDLSADQVLVRPDGRVALLDLDEACWGEAAGDLAGAAAAWWLEDPTRAGALVAALHAGYSSVGTLPPAEVLLTRTAAHLLRRAAEPFRAGAADWPDAVAARVAAARGVLLDGTAAPAAGTTR